MIRDIGIPKDDRIYSLEFYEGCCQKVVSTFKDIQEIRAIYRFGQIGAPGNSDLDFVLVVKKTKNIGNLIKKTFEENFSQTEQYIVYQHDPMILTEPLMSKINFIRNASNLTLLHGKSINIEENLNDEINIIQLVDLVIHYSSHCFKINAPEWYRWPLQIINAYRFIMEKAKTYGFEGHNPAVIDILNQNDKLRANFNMITQNQIRKFYFTALNILQDDILKIEKWLASELPRHYSSWKRCSRNYKVKNIILKNKENRYLNALTQRRLVNIHSGIFSSLFFKANDLPPSIHKAAIKYTAILKSYTKFLYNECNNIGLYRPWHLQSFSMTQMIDHYISNILINFPLSYILANRILKPKSLSGSFS